MKSAFYFDCFSTFTKMKYIYLISSFFEDTQFIDRSNPKWKVSRLWGCKLNKQIEIHIYYQGNWVRSIFNEQLETSSTFILTELAYYENVKKIWLIFKSNNTKCILFDKAYLSCLLKIFQRSKVQYNVLLPAIQKLNLPLCVCVR